MILEILCRPITTTTITITSKKSFFFQKGQRNSGNPTPVVLHFLALHWTYGIYYYDIIIIIICIGSLVYRPLFLRLLITSPGKEKVDVQ